MSYHHRVCEYLKYIDNNEIKRLGGALGLDWPKLNGMTNLPTEMVTAWLREEDKVQNPSWSSLVESLKGISQDVIARNIEQHELKVNTD